jgi:p-methyltransferase
LIGITAQTRTARSCAFKCSFCDYPMRAGALTTASVETVRQEVRALAELGVKNLVFVDDTFNVPPKRFKELCRMMMEEDLGLSWYSYFRCSNARDEETFDLAHQSGCRGVFLGIESGDESILVNMNKLAQEGQYRNGIARLKERGITTFASIIVGFPGENDRTMQNTIDFINETAPTFWRAQPWWGNTRSPVYEKKDVFEIRGEAYNWSHRTMTAREAANWCDVMFEKVTESVWLPLYDFDFWALPYLEGKGLGVEELVPILRISQSIMRERYSASSDAVRMKSLNDELFRAVAALDMAPARFSFASD